MLLLRHRIGTFGIEPQFDDRRFGALLIEPTVPGQASQGRGRDSFSAVLEMLPQVFAILAASETIGAERDQPAGKPRRDLIYNHFHVVGGCDDWSLHAF